MARISFSTSWMSASISSRGRAAVLVEIPVEVDLVAHQPDLPVLRIPACPIDPGVGDVWLHLALEERLDVLQKGHVLRVSELRIGFGAALPVPTNLGRLVSLGQRGENGLSDGRGELELRLLSRPGKLGLENRPIQEECVRKALEQGADGGLLLPTRRLVRGLGGTLLARHRQVDESALVAESSDPLGACLKIEPERPFDRDLAEAEVRGGVDAADDGLALLAVLDDPAGCAVLEVGQQPQNVLLALERDLAALGAQALAQQDPEGGGVDELDPAPRSGRFRLVSTQT